MYKPKILIVDDDSIVAMDLKGNLVNLNYNVCDSVTSGEEALESIKKEKPDIILMDINLPGKFDGIQAAELIKKNYRIPVIFISGIINKELIERVKKTNSYGFVTKPFSSEGIQSSIEIALSKSKSDSKIAHLNNVLRSIRNVNQLIIKEPDIDKLLRGICKTLVEARDFKSSWIILINNNQKIIDFKQYGMNHDKTSFEKYLKQGNLPECAKRAFQQKDVVLIDNPKLECFNCPLLEKNPGFKSLTVSLRFKAKVYGIIAIDYSRDFIIDAEEKKLFMEVADDIAYSLHKFEIEKEQKKEQERFRLTASVTTDLIYEWDIKTDTLKWFGNPEKILGYKVDEFENTIAGWLSMIHPDDLKRLSDVVDSHRESTESIVEEYRIRKKDGTWMYLSDRKMPILDQNNKPVKWIGGCEDITKRKQAEADLKEYNKNMLLLSETAMQFVAFPHNFNIYKYIGEKLQEFIGEKSYIAISSIDMNKRVLKTQAIVGLGNFSEKIAGFLGEQPEGKTFNINDKILRSLHNAIGGKLNLYEDGLYGLSFNTIPKELCYTMEKILNIKNFYTITLKKDNILFGTVIIILKKDAEEITNKQYIETFIQQASIAIQKRQAEQALQDGENKMRSIFRVAPTGIGIVKDRMLYEVNPRFCDMVGYAKEELIGKNARILYPNQEEFEFVGREKYRQIREQGTGMVETRFQKKDGSIINIILSSTPLDINDFSKGVTFTALDITKRKQAEEKLKNSEYKYRTLINTTLEGFWLIDNEYKTIDVNQSLCDMLGYSKNEMIGKIPMDFADEDNKRIFKEQISKIPDTMHRNYEILLKKKNGQNLPTLFKSTSIIEKNGKPAGAFAFVSDISELKQAEEKLNSSLSLLSATLESTADGILVIDNNRKISQWNQKFAKMWNLGIDILSTKDDEKTINEILSQLCNPKQFVEKIKMLYADPEATSFDVLDFKDGRIFERYSQPQRIGDKIIGRVWSFRDITKAKKVEDSLLQSKENLKDLAENAFDCITINDVDGNYLFANKTAAELTGYTVEELLKINVKELTPPSKIKVVQNRMKNRIKGKEESKVFESILLRKDGKEIPIEIAASRTIWEGNASELLFFRDITERKLAKQALQESEEKYRLIVENANDGIEITQNDKIIYTNNRFAEMLGYTAEELKTKHFSQIFTEEASRELIVREKQRNTEKSIPQDYETTFYKKDKTVINVEVHYEIIDYHSSPATFAIIRDITERKKIERDLKNKVNKLEKFNKFTVGRELKMIELKKEINALLEKSGHESKYKIPN